MEFVTPQAPDERFKLGDAETEGDTADKAASFHVHTHYHVHYNAAPGGGQGGEQDGQDTIPDETAAPLASKQLQVHVAEQAVEEAAARKRSLELQRANIEADIEVAKREAAMRRNRNALEAKVDDLEKEQSLEKLQTGLDGKVAADELAVQVEKTKEHVDQVFETKISADQADIVSAKAAVKEKKQEADAKANAMEREIRKEGNDAKAGQFKAEEELKGLKEQAATETSLVASQEKNQEGALADTKDKLQSDEKAAQSTEVHLEGLNAQLSSLTDIHMKAKDAIEEKEHSLEHARVQGKQFQSLLQRLQSRLKSV
jgi:chromosome segregation ATPase